MIYDLKINHYYYLENVLLYCQVMFLRQFANCLVLGLTLEKYFNYKN